MAGNEPYVSKDTQITDKGFTARQGETFTYKKDGADITVAQKLPYTSAEIDLWKKQDTRTNPDGSTTTINRDYTKGRFDPNWVDQQYLDRKSQYGGGGSRDLMPAERAAFNPKQEVSPNAGPTRQAHNPKLVMDPSAGPTRQAFNPKQGVDPNAGPLRGQEIPQPMPREIMPVGEQTLQRPGFSSPNTGDMPQPHTTQLTEQQTVAGNLRELLSADSPYLEQGRQAGLTAMSQRGLQNSSFATQAGEQARIAAALPIAQQDASQQFQQGQLNQNTINQFRENQMDHMQSMIERAQQGDINAQLQLDQYGFNSSLSAQENIQRMNEMAFAGNIEASLRATAFHYDQLMASVNAGHALTFQSNEFQQAQTMLAQQFVNAMGLSAQDAQQRLAELNQGHENTLEEIAAREQSSLTQQGEGYSAQLQSQYLSAVGARQQAASEEIRIIMQTEGLSAAQQSAAVRSAQARMDADVAALQAFYAKAPQWDEPITPAPPAVAPPTDVTPAITPPAAPPPPSVTPPRIDPRDDPGRDERYR